LISTIYKVVDPVTLRTLAGNLRITMQLMTENLADLASINLHYAQAEITSVRDHKAVVRALDHIRQAQACLEILEAEYHMPPDGAEEEVEAAQIQ